VLGPLRGYALCHECDNPGRGESASMGVSPFRVWRNTNDRNFILSQRMKEYGLEPRAPETSIDTKARRHDTQFKAAKTVSVTSLVLCLRQLSQPHQCCQQ